jgi:hypothetical protein
MRTHRDAVLSALPERLPFYHLGEVAVGADEDFAPLADDSAAHRAAAVTVQGDLRCVIAVVFPHAAESLPGEWDASAYLELANLMAARATAELQRRDGLDLIISPPRELTDAQLQALLRSPRQIFKTYAHRSPRRARLRVYIFHQHATVTSKGSGNA